MQDTQFKNELIDIDLEGKTLPAVTAADNGKVLTVEGKNVQGSVLVPEETFVFTDSVMTEIDMENKNLFVKDAECLLTVDGTTITATVQTTSEPDNGLYVEDTENGVVIFLADDTNTAKLFVPNAGTYTVSLYIKGTEYVWTAAEGGEGVEPLEIITINDDGDFFLAHADETKILYTEIVNAVSSGIPILAKVTNFDDPVYTTNSLFINEDAEMVYFTVVKTGEAALLAFAKIEDGTLIMD